MLEEPRRIPEVRCHERLLVVEDPAGPAPRPGPLGAERDDGKRRHGAGDAEYLEDVLGGIVEDERGTVEGDHASEGGRRRREQGVPVQTRDDGVVDVEENALALLRGAELGGPGVHEGLQIRGRRPEIADQAPQFQLGHRGQRLRCHTVGRGRSGFRVRRFQDDDGGATHDGYPSSGSMLFFQQHTTLLF